MRVSFAIILLLAAGILLSGCAQQQPIVCNKPYIQVGSQCCLDKDDNKVCDKDEQKQPPQQNQTPPKQQEQQLPPAQPPAENKTKETVQETEPAKSNATVAVNGCYFKWKGGYPEYIPAASCSGHYDDKTLVRPWCNPETNTLDENCEICGCAEQLPCINRKCERPQPIAPEGALIESADRNFGGLEVKVVKVYSNHTADLEISYMKGSVKQSEIAKIGYGNNIARKVANAWYANLTLVSSGFVPTGNEYDIYAKSWAVIESRDYTSECVPLYLADVLYITYLDGGEHAQELEVAPSWSDQRGGWSLVAKDHRYFELRDARAETWVLNTTSADLFKTGVLMSQCGFDSRQVSVRLTSARLFDYSK